MADREGTKSSEVYNSLNIRDPPCPDRASGGPHLHKIEVDYTDSDTSHHVLNPDTSHHVPISDTSHHVPIPDTSHHVPFPETTHHHVPIPDTSHHDVPIPDTSQHHVPIPETTRHHVPIPETTHHHVPIPDTSNHDVPIPDTSHHHVPIPDTSHHDVPILDTSHHHVPVASSVPYQLSDQDSLADLAAAGESTRIQEQQAQYIKILERALENLPKHYETELQKKDARISDLEERNKHYETELQKKDARISDLEKLNKHYETELQKKDASISDLEERNKHYETKLQEMTTKLKQVTAEEGCENTKKEEYELGEVLGTTLGQSGLVNIRAIKYPSGEERARKSVEWKVLRVSEIAAMLDVQGSLYCPRLHQVDIFMEKIQGKTVHWLIDNMEDLRQCRPELILPVALSIFHDVLSAICLLLSKNWIHGDIHGGNVMVTKDSLQGKVLDLGLAQRPIGQAGKEPARAYRRDVVDLLRLFCCSMIPGFQTWGCYTYKRMEQKEIVTNPETREAVTKAMNGTHEEIAMVLKLIEETYDAVECAKQGQCGDLQPVINTIERMMPARERKEARKEAVIFLFPEFHAHAHDHSTGVDGATPDQGTGMDRDKETVDNGLHIDEMNYDFDSERDRGERAGISTPSGKSSFFGKIQSRFKKFVQ